MFCFGSSSCGSVVTNGQIILTKGRIALGRPKNNFPKIALSSGVSGPHLHGFLGPPESLSETAPRPVLPLLQGSRLRPTDRHTDRQAGRQTDRQTDHGKGKVRWRGGITMGFSLPKVTILVSSLNKRLHLCTLCTQCGLITMTAPCPKESQYLQYCP